MKKRQWPALVLLLPFLLLMGVFAAALGNALMQSLQPASGTGLTLRHYRQLLCDPVLWESLRYSLYLSIVSSVLAAIGAVILCSALVLSGQAQADSITMRLLRLPILVPHVVAALFTVSLFSKGGLLARVLYALGGSGEADFFPDMVYDTAGVGIILAYLWKEIPFIAFYVVTLMAVIHGRLGEAACNLGAAPMQAFVRVTLPMCIPAIRNAFLIVMGFSFGAYELPFLLGACTPRALPVLAYLEYIDPDLKNRPRAMAINGILVGIGFAMAWLYHHLFQKQMRCLLEGGDGQ